MPAEIPGNFRLIQSLLSQGGNNIPFYRGDLFVAHGEVPDLGG